MKIFTEKDSIGKCEKYLYLEENNWDDYSYKSTYIVHFYNDQRSMVIGEAKIIDSDIDVGRVVISNNQDKLPQNFCSLGQTEGYYKKLQTLRKDVRNDILVSLNDCAYDGHILKIFKDLPQFKTSAVRFSQAEQALAFGIEVFNRKPKQDIKPSQSFTFKTQLKGFQSEHNLSFNFFGKSDKKIPSNVNVIIGRNGTGKTQLLSDLAKTVSGYGFDDKKELISSRDNKLGKSSLSFGPVIVISYSAFDNFEIPGKDEQEREELKAMGHVHGYKYCGLRERIGDGQYRLKDIEEITREFSENYKKIKESKFNQQWVNCVQHVLNDPSFREIESGDLHKNFLKLSSGQKIILSILAGVFEHMKSNSLVIIDEPETHLHPSLMSAFMHSIRAMLELFDSYAIIATHSPVILQETPSMFVQILEGTSKRPKVSTLKSECFGEEISTLTEDVFHVSFEESNFYNVLGGLSKQGYSLDEIERMFENRLSFTARSFIEAL
ncbi:AAA family ATPase [Pseudomonas asiatica]|uniref:AAA family ATPase n=1 Tax=Pseudomonas asiatica TaxID=2219225 RepID=UPI001F38C7C4|nr:AAA family ATPase [Pseudomonas asiatica]